MQIDRSLVSIDFWDTLVIAETGGKTRRKIRHEALCEVADDYVKDLPNAQIESATQMASDEFNHIWLKEQRTPSSEELINRILNHLGIPASKKELKYLVDRFEVSMLKGPPDFFEGAKETVRELRSQYKLALISDTMYSPGNVIRRFLGSHEILDCFDSCVFSNETGYSKPNPKAYRQTLEEAGCEPGHSFHIGDRLDTDIRGAHNVGMKGILFTGTSGDINLSNTEIEPDFICKNWKEIRSFL